MIEQLRILELTDEAQARLGQPGDRLQLRRAWPRSSRHLFLEYVDGQGGLVPGQWMQDADQLQRVADETARPQAMPVIVGTDNGQILLQPGGADRRLVGLRALLARPGSTLLVHRPERRAVVRLSGSPEERFAKVVRPSRVGAVVEQARNVWSLPDRPFAVPEVLECDESRGVLMLSVLPGVSLHELLANGQRLIRGARGAGETLRWLHDAAPPRANGHDAQAEISLLQGRLEHLEAFDVTLHRRLGDAPARVFEALVKGSSRSSLIHRDFYDKQIFIGPDGAVGMLDFDTAAVGEPALDVANMLVHLELRVLQGRCSPGSASTATAAFLQGYDPEPGVAARLDAYLDASRLRLACLYAFRPRWRYLLLELVQRIGLRSRPPSPATLHL